MCGWLYESILTSNHIHRPAKHVETMVNAHMGHAFMIAAASNFTRVPTSSSILFGIKRTIFGAVTIGIKGKVLNVFVALPSWPETSVYTFSGLVLSWSFLQKMYYNRAKGVFLQSNKGDKVGSLANLLCTPWYITPFLIHVVIKCCVTTTHHKEEMLYQLVHLCFFDGNAFVFRTSREADWHIRHYSLGSNAPSC